jgi:hypothetical protein
MTEKKAFLLRLDPGIWAELERLAQAELRSVNAQIEFLLRDALARRGITPRRRGGADTPREAKEPAHGHRLTISAAPHGEENGRSSTGEDRWRCVNRNRTS